MRVRKKIPYYAFGIAAIVLLSLLGPLCVVGGQRSFSVLAALWKFPREMLREYSLESACNACGTSWMYLLLPIAAAISSSSYIYEEITSRFYMMVELRKGKYPYVYSAFLYSAVSGGATVALGLAIYALLMACIFPIHPEYGGYVDSAGNGWAEAALGILLRVSYMGTYGMAMSLMATLFVYLYPKLYFDLSILFVVSYMLREAAMREDFFLPLLLIAGSAALYRAAWEWRSRRI